MGVRGPEEGEEGGGAWLHVELPSETKPKQALHMPVLPGLKEPTGQTSQLEGEAG